MTATTTITPPAQTVLSFCPVCGRNDRWAAFTGRTHSAGGKRCPGQPVELTYVLSSVSYVTFKAHV